MMKYRDFYFLLRAVILFLALLAFILIVIFSRSSYIAQNLWETSGSDPNEFSSTSPLANVNILWPPVIDMPSQLKYPTYKNLLDVVTYWNPDIPDPPPEFTESLQHFDYSNPKELAIAERYRDAELPFKFYNVPEFAKISRKWSDEYILEQLKDKGHVEKSNSNHFMYWKWKPSMGKDYVPPTEIISMSFSEWRKKARYADVMKINATSEHFYFISGTSSRDTEGWMGKDLPMFSTESNNFFITNVEANKGIQCRFGMRGIIAESHYDTGRNMIAMLKGNKRYILNPPSACKRLGIITDRKHPSFRHSIIDWSDVAQAKASGFHEVQAIDTIVRTGEVLYIPSFWFHYIISLDYSIQCNSRSGTPPGGQGLDDIQACLGGKLNLGEGKKKRQERRKKKKKMMD